MPSDDEKHHREDLDEELDDEKTYLLSSESDASKSRSPSPEPQLDPRFNRPAPSPFKRAALLIFIGFLVWAAFYMRAGVLKAKQKPQVIYASRYSKEHKFRPAASPIITETLKDGRIRLRGALETPTAFPTPPVVKNKKSGKNKGKRAGKSQKAGKKRP